jgi:hypothetical protein
MEAAPRSCLLDLQVLEADEAATLVAETMVVMEFEQVEQVRGL